jgi:hypothetical protein
MALGPAARVRCTDIVAWRARRASPLEIGRTVVAVPRETRVAERMPRETRVAERMPRETHVAERMPLGSTARRGYLRASPPQPRRLPSRRYVGCIFVSFWDRGVG